MNKLRFKLLLLMPALFLLGCEINSSDVDLDLNLSEKTAKLIEAENEFGFELFQNVFSSEKDYENIMVSPLSVSLALAMTYNGADGETKSAMEKTLKVYGLSSEDINKTYNDLVTALKSLDPKVVLEIANAIFYKESFTIENDFVSINKNYYDADVSALDFGSPAAVNVINNWVAEKTHDKIETIIDRIEPSHILFLLNAIYFKGMWQKEFNSENTKKLSFYLANNAQIQTEFMQRLDTLPYASNDIFSAVKLQYGTGNYNMYVLLPEPDRSVEEIVNRLDEANWETWMKSFQETESVSLQIPKFKYEYEIKLNEALAEMGMGVAFTGAADFSGINRNGGLFIDYVKHKTFVEVNEEGTEAAAVTVVAIRENSVAGDKPQVVPFIANRPFLYAITEKDTGAILFIGTVKNPQAE